MNEILNNAKDIRKVLLNFIDSELKKDIKRKYIFLIDSKTPKELTKDYQKFSNYRMEIVETYNGSQINSNNTNNFFHVAVTYSSFNDNYHMSFENKNFEKVTSNDIVGNYHEENKDKIRKYENKNDSFIEISKDNNKRDIGEKKFSQKRKALYSSINIPKTGIILLDENNSDILKQKKKIDKLDNDHKIMAQEKNETVCVNKKRKFKVSYYEHKLRKYCSNLIILKKKKILNNQKKYKKIHTFKQEATIRTVESPNIKKIKDKIDTRQANSIKIQNKQLKLKPKEKLSKMHEKKPFHKKGRAQSIKDANFLLLALKNIPKKFNSPKKVNHQLTANNTDSKHKEIISQRLARKDRDKNFEEINDVRKMISNGVKNKRKIFAERATIKLNLNMNNKVSQIENKNNNFEPQTYPNKKRHYKRANTLNKMQYIFHFKGSENKLKEKFC